MRTIYKGSKNKLATGVVWRRACQDRDRDYNEPSNGPGKCAFRNVWKQRVAEGVEQECDEIVANVDQKLMPALRHVILVCKRDDSNDKLTP